MVRLTAKRVERFRVDLMRRRQADSLGSANHRGIQPHDRHHALMHYKNRPARNHPAFALDRIEPMRPVVDRVVLELNDAVTFTGCNFSIQPDGVCRPNPELVRRVAELAMDCTDSITNELPVSSHARTSAKKTLV